MTTLLATPAPATPAPATRLLTTPARDRWTLRRDDALVVFRGRASRFAPTVQARFTSVAGTVDEHAVDVDVEVASLTTGSQAYDQVLAAADPFDAARHPVATYRSDQVRWQGDSAVVDGRLTIRGRSAPVRLQAARRELADGVVRVTATGRVDRRPFGLRLEVPGCTSLLVPQCLDLQIDVTAVRG